MLNPPHAEERAERARLEARHSAQTARASFETPRCARLLRMRACRVSLA
jgi:hypothetical protein